MKRMTRCWLVLLGTVVFGFGGSALANPAAQAVIAFLNLADPALVVELQAQFGDDVDALALEVVNRLQQSGVLPESVAVTMRESINSDTLSRDDFVVFLAEVVNGDGELESDNPLEAEFVLAELDPDLDIPEGDASGNLSDEDVAEVIADITTDGDGVLEGVQEAYNDAITPTTG
ncbi:MAG: hypothetical protein JSV66_01205 [Trueperaceae bacterium]|nr:MAG: hypothetical protein JSV66_01205 [Trueperaceae bacterium]